MSNYDVIVVGASFSGLSASKVLGDAGVKTLVVEQNPAIGVPVRSSGGTWLKEMLNLGIPTDFLYEIDELKLFVNEEELGTYVGVNDKGATLRIREFLQWFTEELPYPVVDINLKTKVLDISIDRNELELKTEKGVLRTKYLIDCSGYWALVAKKLGLIRGWERYAVGAEYEIYVGKEFRTSSILLGSKYVKSGYAWMFPVGRRVRIGVGVIRPFTSENPLNLLDKIVSAFRKLILRDAPSFNPVEFHFGMFPCQGILNPLVHKNIILAGDAGGLGSPLLGEGIRFAIITGRKAAETVIKALSKNDLSMLKEYEDWIRSTLKRDFELALKIQTIAATSYDDDIRKYVRTFNHFYQKNPQLAEDFFKSRLTNVLEYLVRDVQLSDLMS